MAVELAPAGLARLNAPSSRTRRSARRSSRTAAARQPTARPLPAITAAVLPGTPATDRTRTASAISAIRSACAAEKIDPARARSVRRDGSTRSARIPTTSTNGKASTKALRHDPYCASMPPTNGPTIDIGPHTLDTSAMARERSWSGNRMGISEVATAASRPPAKPWMARPRMTTAMLGAAAQHRLPPRKNRSPSS